VNRYQTRRGVAVTWAAAIRLARIDGTPPDAIRSTFNVELIHRTDWWAWWSDEQLTTAIGLPEELRPVGLSAVAEELITDVWAGDAPAPQCGWATLAQVQRIVDVEPLTMSVQVVGDRLITNEWEALTVEFRDGQQRVLYQSWSRYEEGYRLDIRMEPPNTP